MALTKKDLQQISNLFNEGYKEYFLPHFERIYKWQEKVESWQENVESWQENAELSQKNIDLSLKSLNNSMGSYVVDSDKKFEKNAANIGHYFEKCVSKQEFSKLSKRVKKLELARP
jgi:hypothetical protein